MCSNQIIAIICQVLKYLRKFSFVGSDLTHPGVMSILERKSTLQQLCIQSPRYLTKYSMKLLSNEMTLLETFKYEPWVPYLTNFQISRRFWNWSLCEAFNFSFLKNPIYQKLQNHLETSKFVK